MVWFLVIRDPVASVFHACLRGIPLGDEAVHCAEELGST